MADRRRRRRTAAFDSSTERGMTGAECWLGCEVLGRQLVVEGNKAKVEGYRWHGGFDGRVRQSDGSTRRDLSRPSAFLRRPRTKSQDHVTRVLGVVASQWRSR